MVSRACKLQPVLADGRKLGVVDASHSCAAAQRDLNRWEKSEERRHTKLSKGKRRALPLGSSSHAPVRDGERLAGKQLCSKGLTARSEQQVAPEPVTCPCSRGGQQDQGCISRYITCKWREAIPPLWSALVRHLEQCPVWGSPAPRRKWTY